MKHSILTWILATVLALGWAVPVYAQDARPPVNITADRMDANDNLKVVTFTGNVVGRQEDIILTCHVMRVYYQETEESKTAQAQGGEKKSEAGSTGGFGDTENEILRIECEGDVKITKGEQVAQAQMAVYLAKADPRQIILTGEPSIWKNKDYLTGKRIVYFVDEGRSMVEGGREERVNAVFYTGESDNGAAKPEAGNNDESTESAGEQ